MFDQITGNERVKNLLRRMLDEQRVPGALLFSGPEGVGKKFFAFELARALNCRSQVGNEACGVCSVCKRITNINYPTSDDPDEKKRIFWTDHPDVGFVQPPNRLFHVNQMRDIRRESNYHPFEGRARVFVVDDADKFNDQSANALLKTLEEPSPTSHLILITARPAMLLPTIRSRCQQIRFSPLTAAEIERYLLDNKLESGGAAKLRARCAAGSLGRALADDLDSYKKRREEMLGVLQALAVTGDRTRLLRAAEGLSDTRNKDDYEANLELLETLIRDSLLVALAADQEQVVNIDILTQLQEIAHNTDAKRATNWIAQIEEVREQLEVNINRKPATDSLFLTMAGSLKTR
jgi:DNA polymerase-3 subunit delta'